MHNNGNLNEHGPIYAQIIVVMEIHYTSIWLGRIEKEKRCI